VIVHGAHLRSHGSTASKLHRHQADALNAGMSGAGCGQTRQRLAFGRPQSVSFLIAITIRGAAKMAAHGPEEKFGH
jgi:hypothetical protein